MYDYVIVGGGTAGSVIAARLTEDPGVSVLVLEAGPDFADVESLPHDVAYAYAVSVKDHDWGYRAEAVPGRYIDYARGRVIGGCSSINGTIALRGMPSDYDEWASLGNDEWSWERTLPYFLKIENDQDFPDREFHGDAGPLPIVRTPDDELVPLQKAFLRACVANGLDYVADHNDPATSGVGPIPMNRRGELRVSAAVAWLNPARGRPNLEIRDRCLVNRVVFEGARATGVEIVGNDGRAEVIEAGAVVLSAGALGSPSILLRSGVGPTAELDRLGVPTVRVAPGVGENLTEHQQIFVAFIPKEGVTNHSLPDVQLVVDYTAAGSDKFNDMQIYCVNKFGKERFPKLESVLGDVDLLFAVMLVLNRAKSRGRLTLASADPSAAPEVALNCFDHPHDMERIREGLRRCWAIGNSDDIKAMSVGIAVLNQETVDDDEKLSDYVASNSATIWHPVGTCKMGPASDDMAVVDQYGRVHGLQNLRVADASIFPEHVSRNPMLTTLVIGERVAEWIGSGR